MQGVAFQSLLDPTGVTLDSTLQGNYTSTMFTKLLTDPNGKVYTYFDYVKVKPPVMQRLNPIFATLIGCGSALLAAAAPVPSSPTPTLDWDKTFHAAADQRPLHFIATYQDAHGPHRLEEWRLGDERLRRLTDARIDLHADRTKHAAPRGGR